MVRLRGDDAGIVIVSFVVVVVGSVVVVVYRTYRGVARVYLEQATLL